MKKLFSTLSVLMLLSLLMPSLAKAQQLPAMGIDKEVRIGKLPNGLTYYIRHNDYPKGQADFYIAQKVGSVLENDEQRSLAHFLEHMCFNGTTNFPGKNLINYLQSVGVKFSVNLNAYTAVDETVYRINNVPVTRQGVQDSCLLILHDWANDLLLLPEEIDAERAVIHEEWRQSYVGQMRILENSLPVLLEGTQYAYRMPIGTMDVVDNFPPQALRDYYEKWYRPDLQGIVVVGDIDVDRIEAKIKEMFADIEMPENPAERIYFPIPDTEGTIYYIGHDKEQTITMVQLMMKSDPLPREYRGTMALLAQNYMLNAICSMINQRLDEASKKPDALYAAAQVYYGSLLGISKTKDGLTLGVIPKGATAPEAMAQAYRELLRAVRGGFTASEYDRTRQELLSRYEKAYNNRETRENTAFAQEYVRHFLDGNAIPDIEEEYNTIKLLAQQLPVQAINATIKELVTPDNRLLLCLCPDNAENVYPTKDQFADALAAVDSEEIAAFVDDVKTEPLIAQMPTPGKIVKEEELTQWGATQWTLSNGAKVIVKHTDFKKDDISMAAVAPNGTSELPESMVADILFSPVALSYRGLGTYTNSDLDKYLSGKQANVSPAFNIYSRTIAGNTTPKDLPTMMELLYMNFTGINFTEDEFKALQSQYSALIKNQEADPQFIFQTKIYESLFRSPRMRALTHEDVDKADRQTIIKIAHDMTANAAEYTFVFVGNVDLQALRPLVEQYIASLPADAKAAEKNRKIRYNASLRNVQGTGTDTYTTAMQTPQTWVYITSFATLPFSTKASQLNSIAAQILSKRLLDIVREKEGAVYSISAQGAMDRLEQDNAEILTAFPMKPELKQKVLDIIREQFEDMTRNVSDEELATVKEYMAKSYVENREKNGPWLSAITGWLRNGVDTFNGNTDVLATITTADVKAFMKQLLDQKNYRVIVLDPQPAE
ncbi:MAG: insulinase family protein [Muribaculaceae bacterium]|nr:insulinase family protein [Muribaculaceae bacterium]